MLYRRPQPKSPRRPFVGDNPVFRAAFREDCTPGQAPSPRCPGVVLGLFAAGDELAAYRVWLHANGIDPDTGKMTADGLAFFKNLLDSDRARKVRRRFNRR